MEAIQSHLLSYMIFSPIVGAAGILLVLSLRRLVGFPQEQVDKAARGLALVFSAIPLGLGLWLWASFDGSHNGPQFIEHAVWIRAFGIEYFIGADGLSVAMIILSALVSFIATIASMPWFIRDEDDGHGGGHHPVHFSKRMVPGYLSLLLLLQSAMVGVFASLDFFLFYVFWELMLLPMYFLIGIWGGPRKEYAAIKFFLYTLAGSVLMLLAVIGLYYASTPMQNLPLQLVDGTPVQHTFNMLSLAALGGHHLWAHQAPLLGMSFARVIWIGLFIGFAIKIPMFPFHTWLPDAHVEAPTPVSVILAGVLLKMGGYGILRVNFGILPDATRYFADAMAIFGTINIVYGAFVCLAQKDLKKLIAYSSVSHMGFVLLGMASLTPLGLSGAMLQMWTHGIVSAMLFLIVGVIYDRAHHREIEGFGGLAAQVPEYTALMGLAFFASMGLPGLCGFVSEFMVFQGAFGVYRTLTIISATSVILTASYYLWTIQRMFLGKLNEKYVHLEDVNWRERLTLYPLGALALFFGFYPQAILETFNRALEAMSRTLMGRF
ncbi:MAG: complex I subunit 4 family protein [Deltaproteobacteria bacterium]